MKPAPSFEPLPSSSTSAAAPSLTSLDAHLADNAYLGGAEGPGEADFRLASVLKNRDATKGLDNLGRWLKHVSSFEAEERRALGVGAGDEVAELNQRVGEREMQFSFFFLH